MNWAAFTRTVLVVAALSAAAPALADETVDDAAIVFDSPAPSFRQSGRAKLSNVAFSASQAPVWSGQAGPSEFVQRFSSERGLSDWHVASRGSNGWWSENDWRADHVRQSDHGLALVLDRSGGGASGVSSGEISHLDKFQYGYFETQMRTARGEGLVSGFFTFAREGSDEKTWNEIDIEILGKSTDRAELTVHAEGRKTHKTVLLGFDSAKGFHTYGFDWTPDAVRWYIDGVMVHEATGPVVERLKREQSLHLNLVGTRNLEGWAGRLDIDGGPYAMDIACVGFAPSYDGKPLCAS